ncbi:MAG TPA: putative manganese transporter [Bacilli bacterium]|nr:putative manganese transporter [Bacilli bacterium]
MKDVLMDTLIDSVKLLPFLFITFLLLEFIEHKMSNKNKKVVEKSGKFGPFFGSVLGAFPQCGFSAAATNLYAARVISVGTLISIYLSTSDEMLPILLSEKVSFGLILSIIGLKIVIGMICGFIIDFILRKKEKSKEHIHDMCEHDHCDCSHGIIKSSIIHTLSIIFFILIASFVLNTLIYFIGEENIGKIFLKESIFGPFISSLIGLIPNCAASVVITELYLTKAISFGSMIAGLLTGAGVGLLILFKENKNMKENIYILFIIYGLGVISGIIIELIGMII